MNQAVPTQAPPSQGPLVRFFKGLWDVMNFIRRLILNVVFFGLLLILAIAFLAALGSGGVKPLLDRTTLVIAPEGKLVEQYSCDPVSRAFARASGGDSCKEVQLRDMLRVLDAARTDKSIERVLLRTDKMAFSGYASIREVAAAVAKLRAAGKQVVAFGENFDQGQYLLAAQANEVYLDPMGGVLLEGLSRYTQYFREGLQDKLGVDVHVFKVGTYKSAVEPYILDAASPAAKEADLYWMNDVWQRYLGDLAGVRKTSAQALAADIDQLPTGLAAAQGDLGKYALQKKLVDGLKTEDEVDDLLAKRGVADSDADDGFREIGFDDYLKRVGNGFDPVDERPAVAVVVAEGEIVQGEQPPGSVGGESTADLLRAAKDDDKVKAVVLRVNSPGGDVFASEQIRRQVAALKAAGKPVVVSMGDVAASGGYWISMNGDRIFADPSTITGSIGIFGVFPTISRTLDKFGIHTDGVSTTKYAGAFDITRPLDPDVGSMIQSVIDKGYRDFTGRVADARHQSVQQIDAVAQGRVWSGAEAKDRGLVDQFGGLQDAIADAATRAKLGKPGSYQVRYAEKIATPFERIFGRFASSHAGMALLRESPMLQTLFARTSPQADQALHFVQDALQHRTGQPIKALAYCFCGF